MAEDTEKKAKEEIEKMVQDAEKFKDEDDKLRKKVDAKNGLESYIFQMKNTLNEENLKDKFSDEDKKTIEDESAAALQFLEGNPDASAEEYEAKQKEIEAKFSPIMQKVYQAAGGAPGAGGMPGAGPTEGPSPETDEGGEDSKKKNDDDIVDADELDHQDPDADLDEFLDDIKEPESVIFKNECDLSESQVELKTELSDPEEDNGPQPQDEPELKKRKVDEEEHTKRYQCNQCDNIYNKSSALIHHKLLVHEVLNLVA